MHAHAHRCSHLHVFLPARKNSQRLPLLHPHCDHHNYCCCDHHHYHRSDDDYYDYCCGYYYDVREGGRGVFAASYADNDCDDYHDGCDHDIDIGWFWCFPAGEDYDYDGCASCLCRGAVSCCGCEGVRDFPGASAAGGGVPCFGEFEGVLAGDDCERAAEERWRRCV